MRANKKNHQREPTVSAGKRSRKALQDKWDGARAKKKVVTQENPKKRKREVELIIQRESSS